MKSTIKFPIKEYPYLAVYTGDARALSNEEILEIQNDEIVLISRASKDEESDKEAYIQPLFGGKVGYFTKEENLYSALPKGTEITFIQ
jgi:hypothetical protein